MQNLASLQFNAQDLADFDAALDTLRRLTAGFVSLTPDERREAPKMGARNEPFARDTLVLLQNNPQIVPPSLALADAVADLAAIDALRPRLQRLQQLVERMEDTEMAPGSDVLVTALEGYALLGVSGENESLKSARRALSARFARSPKKPVPVEA